MAAKSNISSSSHSIIEGGNRTGVQCRNDAAALRSAGTPKHSDNRTPRGQGTGAILPELNLPPTEGEQLATQNDDELQSASLQNGERQRINRVYDVETFTQVRDRIKVKLKSRLENPKDRLRRFCPRWLAYDVMCDDDRRSDIKALYISAGPPQSSHSAQAQRFLDIVLGAGLEKQDRESLGLARVFATIIFADITPDTMLWTRFEERCLQETATTSQLTVPESDSRRSCYHDKDLPFNNDQIDNFFGAELASGTSSAEDDERDSRAVEKFKTHQPIFSAIVLQKSREYFYTESARLPYLNPKEHVRLGSGAYGEVYKVEIARGHMEGSSRTSNHADQQYARNDFQIDSHDPQAAGGEWEIVKRFLREDVQNNHIMMALASLRQPQEGVFSIFYPLAGRDLWKHMTNDEYWQRGDLDTGDGKRKIFGQMLGVAGALEFLHIRLGQGQGQMTCFHLDLKPANILVVDEEQAGRPVEVFKITDFSVSGIEERAQDRTYLDRNLFGRREGVQASSSTIRDKSTGNRIGEGSHCLAPEASVVDARVQASTDIWALGCVLC